MTELSDAQRKLLEARLAKAGSAKKAPAATPPTIPAHGKVGPLPLSAGQQALLFDYHRRAGEPVYNVCHSYRIEGDFDLTRFGDAVSAVVATHEPLHVSFGPERRVLPVAEAVSVEYVEDVASSSFDELAAGIAAQRINLEDGPLLRVVIAPLGDRTFGVVLALHHVSCDAGSLAALWADIAMVYGGGELDGPVATYSDHGEWQRAKVSDDDTAWWLDQLGPSPQSAALSFARVPDEPDGYLTRQLGASAADVDSFGARPMPVLLSAFGALLQHLAAADDPVVAVAMSTRDHPATDAMVGYFLSMLPFRVPVEDHTFRSLISEVEQRLAGGLSRRHVPLGEIVRHVRNDAPASVDIDSLTQTMFVFDAAHRPELPGVTIDEKIHPNGSSVSGLTLFVRPAQGGKQDGGWEASLEYSGDVCSSAQATMILERFDATLSALIASPDVEIRNLDLPSSSTDLHGGEITAAIRPISEIIADIAEAGPIAPAVRCGDEALSYDELCDRANLLARRLRDAGVGRADRVAIVLPRSVDVVVAILGVLRAGASYVPIDPSYPSNRTSLILDAADPKVLIVGDSVTQPVTDLPVVSVPSRGGGALPADPSWRPSLDDPAYVIFTSGSTGTPRGVEVSHRNLATSTLSRFDVYENQPESFLLLSSYGFDSSIVGLFWTLAAGGEIVIPTDAQTGDFDEIALLASSAEVSHLLSVPTLYDALLRRSPDRLSSLRVAIIAGEAAPVGIVDRHADLLPLCQLVNEYGPTEATVWATSYDCVGGSESVPIGRPVPGVVVRVADHYGRALPAGVAGELWIGGTGVTDGYLNDPVASAAKFVPDTVTGETWFRTGDLVRVNQDLELDFLGRVDNQLSLGGVRVEPEEIEAVLSAHWSVQASVVLIDPNGRLIALVEPEPNKLAGSLGERIVADLQQLATEHLPAALVPRSIVVVDQLPRTVHGKVDRANSVSLLPKPSSGALLGEPSGSPIMDDVLNAWREVLDNNTLQSDADFFESGGDSLRALELCERLETLAGRRVGMGELIDARTPEKLALALGLAAEHPDLELELFEVLRSPSVTALVEHQPTLVLLPPGGGNLLAYQALVRKLDEDQPIIGFRLPGSDGRSEPVHTIGEQADRILPELLAATPPDSAYNLLGWSTGGLLALELASRLERLGRAVNLVGMVDTIYPGYQTFEQAGKLSKYRSLLVDGGARSVADHARLRVKTRIRELSESLRARSAERFGAIEDAKANERRLFAIAFEAAETYRPPVYDGAVTFFAASATDTRRTIVPWSDHLATVDVMVVDGEHAEENAVLDHDRVGPIADHITKLLND